MKNISSKKIYFYATTILLFCYLSFVMLARVNSKFIALYSMEVCSTYYVLTYMGLSAVMYAIDSKTKKEPAFLSLFCLPIYSFAFIFLCLLVNVYNFIYYLLLLVATIILIGIGIVFNKYGMKKLTSTKNGYQIFLFTYIVIHLFIVLLIGLSIL